MTLNYSDDFIDNLLNTNDEGFSIKSLLFLNS